MKILFSLPSSGRRKNPGGKFKGKRERKEETKGKKGPEEKNQACPPSFQHDGEDSPRREKTGEAFPLSGRHAQASFTRGEASLEFNVRCIFRADRGPEHPTA